MKWSVVYIFLYKPYQLYCLLITSHFYSWVVNITNMCLCPPENHTLPFFSCCLPIKVNQELITISFCKKHQQEDSSTLHIIIIIYTWTHLLPLYPDSKIQWPCHRTLVTALYHSFQSVFNYNQPNLIYN